MKIKKLVLILITFLIITKNYALDAPKNLIIKELKKSEKSEKLKTGNFAHLHYRGWLYNNQIDVVDFCNAKGKMFDSTLDEGFRDKPGTVTEQFVFQKGKNNVIIGWELGTEDMIVGSKRCLVIPPIQAYGTRKIGEIIPANSTLIFEIELMRITDKKEK